MPAPTHAMARLTRLAIEHQLHLLAHRAAAGVAVLADATDRADYLGFLGQVARELGVAVHAYVLLPDRVQLLLTPPAAPLLPQLMQRVGRRFSAHFNARYQRQGSPWAGRYRVTVLQPERYLLDAMRLLESAPVRAGLIAEAAEWPASSAAHHCGLWPDPLVTEHPGYWVLGNTPFEREARYRSLLAMALPAATVTQIEAATHGGWVMGDDAFVERLGKGRARRLQQQPKGRPAARQAHLSDPI
jgi:putative transposase